MKTTMKQRTIRPVARPKSRNRLQDATKVAVTCPSRIRSVLVPIDFSKPAERALDYAVSLAKQFGAKLTLLNVIEPFPTPDFAYYPLVM